MAEIFTCNNCGGEFPASKLKEVVYEEGRKRIREELCPSCLDKRMNSAVRVRGVVGEIKRAAIHVDEDSSRERRSLGERN